MKKLFLLIFIISILLAGCSDENSSTTESTKDSSNESSSDTTTITIAHVQGENASVGGWPDLENVAAAYKEETGNTIDWIYVPAEEIEQWTQTQFIGGTAPDIIWSTGQKASDFLSNEWIIDLKPYFEEDSPYTGEPWKESFIDGVLQGVTDQNLGEAMVGVPGAFVREFLFYNKEIFEKAGLHDRAPETWSEVLEFAKKIEEYDSDVVPFSIQNSMPWNLSWLDRYFMMDVWTDVVPTLDVIKEDGTLMEPELAIGVKTGIISATDQRMIDYYSFLKELSNFFNRGFNTASWEYEALFNQNNAAMQINGSWYFKQHMENDFEVEYGIGPMPYVDVETSSYGPGERRNYKLGQLGPDFVVTQKAKDEGRAKAAVDFLRYITDPNEGGRIWVEETMFAPVVKDVDVPEIIEPVVESIGEDEVPFGAWSPISFTSQASDEYQMMLRQFLEDDSTPEEFANDVQELFESSVKDAINEHSEWEIDSYLDKIQ